MTLMERSMVGFHCHVIHNRSKSGADPGSGGGGGGRLGG